jgi:PAS domain S-box-containing protein
MSGQLLSANNIFPDGSVSLLDPFLNLGSDATLTSIPYSNLSLSIHEKACQATIKFEVDFSLPGILLVDGKALVGMLSRKRFYEMMSRPFSLELFPQRSLSVLWRNISSQSLILDAETPIAVATQYALRRQREDIYEPLVIQFSTHKWGVIDIHTLLLAHNSMYELILRELQSIQQALFNEKELAQTTLRSIVDGVITTNTSGKIQEMNPIAEKLTGWRHQNAIGKDISDIFQLLDEANPKPIENPVFEVLRNRAPIYSHRTFILHHSSQHWDVQYSASPIFNRAKQLLGAILVFRDVTQQQKLLRKIH